MRRSKTRARPTAFAPLAHPVTVASVARALAMFEVRECGVAPCPCCLESRFNEADPVTLSPDLMRWRCDSCESQGGPLAFVFAFFNGEVPPEHDPRIEEARAFLRSLPRKASP